MHFTGKIIFALDSVVVEAQQLFSYHGGCHRMVLFAVEFPAVYIGTCIRMVSCI